ncbi:YbbR-like protein [Tangfeifania diversioriginum]|uniref:YbbR-like protein n=1 Tax=Tangfeifania diversioriginum TaxID=1168035 RepID=A0A1M6M6N5_9BACT|nr:CdaR family protein [Tangfeifania diversioriginum]SHJ78933.1 YbbR-like protein [Tangfeifania diversioriginum]
MKKKLTEIVNYFNFEKLKKDRRLIVFAVCLLIATALWFLNALSKDYTTTINYPVKYTNPPEEMFLTSTPPKRFELKVEGHGFSILRYKLILSPSPIVLDLASIHENHEGSANIITIQSQSLIERVSQQVTNEISIAEISPNVITLIFDSAATKTLPVKTNLTTTFKPQFYLKNKITFQPESIKISGPSTALDTIRFLETESVNISEIDENIEKVVQVKRPLNTELSSDKVLVKIPVEKFTEKELTIPVEIKNKPEGVSVKLFPSEVKVSFLVGMSNYESTTTNSFKITVDFNQADNSSETLDVTIDSKPPFIQSLRVSPQSVDFLVETD